MHEVTTSACPSSLSRTLAGHSMNAPRVQIIAGSAVLVLAVVAVALSGLGRGPRGAAQALPASTQTQTLRNEASPVPPLASAASTDSLDVPQAIAPLPANATAVPDEDLLKLSGMVRLANARYARPDKARWSQAVPIAQQLLTGPCDCEQRNWLNHFIAMGNDAIANSDNQYHEEAQLLATLGRNDQDAMARQHRSRTN